MSLLNTRLQNMRANSRLDKWEHRASRYGALDLFQAETNNPNGIISPELRAKARNSIGRLLEVPVIDFNQGLTIGNTRNLIIADSENTSQMVSVTFQTYTFGFTVVPAAFMNNEISMQRDFNTKMEGYLLKLAETLDSTGLAALSASKTQVFGNDLGIYAPTGNVVIATDALKDQIIGDIDPMMHSNDFYGMIHVVGETGLESIVKKMSEHDIYNDQNKTIQYSDKQFHFSNRLANDTGHKATGYAVNAGSLGMLERFEREALLGTDARTGHSWDIVNLPIVNIPCGSYFYESVGDQNAIHGAATADLDRGLKRHYGFAVDIAFMTAYNSDQANLASPVMKFAITQA